MKFTLKDFIRKISILLLSGSPLLTVHLYADDTEIYTGALSGGFSEQIRPNILYVIDTSGSMRASAGFFINPDDYWGAPYDPDTDYSAFGDCYPSRVYRVSASELDDDGNHVLGEHGYPIEASDNDEVRLPACGNFYFPLNTLVCKKAMDAFADKGWYFDYWGEKSATDKWSSLDSSRRNSDIPRECWGDWGSHGETDGSPDLYPYKTAASWGSNPFDSDAYRLDQRAPHIVATGNFLNWFNVTTSRLAAAKLALKEIVTDLPGDTVIGLMHFDSGANDLTDGGMMVKEFARVGEGTNRQDFIDTVFSIPEYLRGSTPLGETLLEALYAFSGRPVYFGTKTEDDYGNWFYSVEASRKSTDPSSDDYKYYKSPIEYTCQSSHVIFLSDGAATFDDDAWSGRSLINFELEIPDYKGGFEHLLNYERYAATDCDHGCLDEIAEYMANEDIGTDVPGDQHVFVSTIGFGDDLSQTDQQMLERTAEKGKGTSVMANDFDTLRNAFRITTRKAIIADTAFTAPALAVNAFNRTQDGNRIYFALFKTSIEPGWGGNLKAYELDVQPDGSIAIEDAAGEPAVDTDTGLFHFYARSIWSSWSSEADGNEALSGGAASNIPTSRQLYTWFGGTTHVTLIDSEFAFAEGNSQLTDERFGMDGTEMYDREDIINWLGGIDPTTGLGRHHMGDPLHSRPVVVTYGETEASPDQKIFVTTNDGMLHIIDVDNGVEDFAFIAEESLQNAKRMYEGDSDQGKAYGLDGALQLYIDEGAAYEPGISGDDKVYLYAGMRRGGRNLYAFDMTDYNSPKLMWRIQGGDVDDDGTDNDPFHYLGYTFSTPQIGELKIDGNPRKILIFGGGYDLKQDDPDGSAGTTDDTYVEDDYGNAIYIVDALTGERLWWASSHADIDADLVIPEMVNSIPSDVAVIDIDNDGWTDRLYVGDTGGRIFRIDLEEFNPGTNIGATGGMIADIGGSSYATAHPDLATVPHNRKLFYAPDIVRVENGDDDYLAIAFGTGNRAHPSYPTEDDTAVADKFFVLKDPHILTKPGTLPASYDYGIRMGDDGHLYNATDNLVMATDTDIRNDAINDMNAAKGWFIDLAHEGEKALAPAVTLNYTTHFTTFEPLELDLANCEARTGIGRLYTIDIRNGKPVNPNYYAANPGDDPDTTLETEDRIHELARDGIPPAYTFTFPEAANGETTGFVGTEMPPPTDIDNVLRSYWRTQ